MPAMRRLHLWILSGAATLMAATIAWAQTPPVAAAPRPMPKTYPLVTLYGYPDYLAAGEARPLRRATAVSPVSDWMPDNDPLVMQVAAGTASSGNVAVKLTIEPTGRVSACELLRPYGEARLFEGLCDRIAGRAQLKPAIDDAGAPVTDRFILSINVGRSFTPQTRLVVVSAPSPAPPPPGGQWPPSWDSQLATVQKLDLLPGGPTSAEARSEPWAGIEYSPEDPRQPCRIVKSSGDAAFDARACKTAAKGRYDVSKFEKPWQRRMQLHFVLSGGKPRALLPVQKWSGRPVASQAARAAVVAALPAEALDRVRLNVMVELSGAVSRCTIETSSGTDAGDVAACAAVRANGPFAPATDIFGRPFRAQLYDWSPAKEP
jgi:hypothetical protein